MLSTKVKASAITHLTDARYFAAWGVRWMGFNLSPGDDTYIAPMQVNAIKEWVDGPLITGEFGASQSSEDIRAGIELLDLDVVQVDTLTSLATIQELDQQVPVIKEWVVDEGTDLFMLQEDLFNFAPHCEALLLNFTKGGLSWADIGQTAPLDQDELLRWAEHFPLLLEIDFGDVDAADLLTELPLYGISVRGGEEEKVGYKSFDEIDTLFEQLEVAR